MPTATAGIAQYEYTALLASATVHPHFLAARKNELRQPAPWLEFWDLDLDGSGANFLRLVDFAEDEANTITSQIQFDGELYWPVKIRRDRIDSTLNEQRTEARVTFVDVSGKVGTSVRENNGLIGQIATLRIIPHDRLKSPASAKTFELRVRNSEASDRPTGITLRLGRPAGAPGRVPRKDYVRNRCKNDYTRRHIFGNPCNYPDDEFEEQTRQGLRNANAVDTDTTWKHGIHTLNASVPDQLDAGFATTTKIPGILTLRCEVTANDKQWLDATRTAPYVFKVLPGGDFDVWTTVAADILNARTDWQAGLVVQDPASEGDSLMWAAFGDGNAGEVVTARKRKTASDVSTDTDTTLNAAGELNMGLRMERVGDDFTLYTGTKDFFDDAGGRGGGWVQRDTETFVLPSTLRVGIVFSTDTVSASTLFAHAANLRFYSGGLPTCDRDFGGTNGCQAHDNVIQFNAFLNMPEEF